MLSSHNSADKKKQNSKRAPVEKEKLPESLIPKKRKAIKQYLNLSKLEAAENAMGCSILVKKPS